MKNKRLISFFSLGIISLVLIVFACSKEKNISEDNQQPDQTHFEQQVFIKAIKDFKQKVANYEDNAMYKSGETVDAESAMLLLEGTINYSHAFITDLYDETLVEDLTLVVPKDGNGEVDMDVLIQKYLDMKADITAVYYASNFENKGLVVVDLTETEQSEDEITLNVGVVTGERGVDPPPNPGVDGPFEAGDNWWYGEDEEKCYDTISVSDAAEELEDAMSDYMYDYNQSHGIYFIAPFQMHKFQGGDGYLRRAGDTEDNHLDYYMYFADDAIGISDDTLCVEWPEMNIYFTYLKYWLYNKMTDSLNEENNWNYHPVSVIDMEGDYNDDYEWYYHRGYYLFGHPWYYEEGDGPEEL
ncbi:MAG: hypothetical protein K9G76_11055 [Bacteroidales bacterium]|nr:hypothetical protein [Bacteroidales bacterium]MCF8404931.1 hypothetical protein [Bacteroidales bacterium]